MSIEPWPWGTYGETISSNHTTPWTYRYETWSAPAAPPKRWRKLAARRRQAQARRREERIARRLIGESEQS